MSDSDSGDDKVVFLKFDSSNTRQEYLSFVACGSCRNKTFTATYEEPDQFPIMKCAACGMKIGRFGWAPEKDEGKR